MYLNPLPKNYTFWILIGLSFLCVVTCTPCYCQPPVPGELLAAIPGELIDEILKFVPLVNQTGELHASIPGELIAEILKFVPKVNQTGEVPAGIPLELIDEILKFVPEVNQIEE